MRLQQRGPVTAWATRASWATRATWATSLGVALAALLALCVESGRSLGQPPKEQQIQEVEKQIAELTKKLTDLKTAKVSDAIKPVAAKSNDTAKDTAPAAPDGGLPADWVKSLTWRDIGPAAMSGRITAITVSPTDPSTWWIATASGGLLKTTNNGVTFQHQFDKEATVSIGDVCVAPSNKDIVWVGTGESNPRNSVSYGDGVYKSTNGGRTWKNMGLKKSFQTGKLIIHPTDPNTVYVGALGRLYGPNEERGLFKTTDGGGSWQKILYVDDRTGVIDMRMQPNNPETLIVATWERQRDGFDGFFGTFEGDQYGPIKNYTPGTALHKTTDGGKTFHKLTQGLPATQLGRIGLDWYQKDPNVVYAIIDTDKVGTTTAADIGVQGKTAKDGVAVSTVTASGPAAKAEIKVDDVLTTIAGKEVKEFTDIAKALDDLAIGDKVKVAFLRGTDKKEVEVTLGPRPAQGGGARGAGGNMVLAGFFGEDAEGGVRVTRLIGEDTGIQPGDLVQTIDGKPVSEFRSFFQTLAETKKAGDKVKVVLERDADKKELEVTLTAPAFGGGGGRGGVGGGFGGGGPGGGAGRTGGTVRPFSSGLGGQRENVHNQQGKGGFNTGGLFKSTDAGETWTRINSVNPRPMYFSQIRVDPSDDKYLYVLGVSLYRSTDGGKTFRSDGSRGVHADQHALWIDSRDGRHMIVGCDGGFYATYDRMNNWDHLNTAALGQFYHVAIDTRKNYKVYGGLQDNGSWGGPSNTKASTGPINEDWIRVGGGDGFTCRVDPNDPELVYYTSQNGSMGRRNLRTGETGQIRPRQTGVQGRGGEDQPRAGGPARAEGQPPPEGQPRGQGQPRGEGPGQASRYRWNWNTPFILSNHNSRIFYCAGNFVFRSLDRGNDLQVISPEITASNKGSGTALSESPRNPNVIYAGTDDGNLWITKDGGKEWKEISKKVGLPGPRWVSTIEASRFGDGRCYVCFDAHRSDDDMPCVYVTEDFGETWKPLHAGLPVGSTRCLREDLQNQNLLFVGTEFGAFASTNRGASWTRINNNLPTVAVHEFAIHPTMNEMVAATHGRSLWVLDITALRQITPDILKADAALLKPNTAIRWKSEPNRGGTNRRYTGTNPPSGAQIYYVLNKKAEKASIKVLDVEGKTLRELTATTAPGMRKVTWDLSRAPERRPGDAAAGGPGAGGPGGGRGGFGGGGGGFGGRGGFGGGQAVQPGTYRVVLTVDGKEYTQTVRVESDPSGPPADVITEEEEDDMD